MASIVKKEGFLLPLFIGFIIGFIAGTGFAVFKLDPGAGPVEQQQPESQGRNGASVSDQQAEAIINLKAEVASNPDNVDSWTRLGHLYYDTDQAAKAIDAYKRSLELHPSNSDVLTDLGVMYRRAGKPEKAISTFDKAIQFSPSHQPARINKGVVLLYDLNDAKGAFTIWEELLTINPNAKMPNGLPVTEYIAKTKEELKQKPLNTN